MNFIIPALIIGTQALHPFAQEDAAFSGLGSSSGYFRRAIR
jgi:hypothetical protein